MSEPEASSTVSFGFNLAKIADHGEDSDPILREGPDLALVAVFDGMGGAGGTVYDTPDGARSGAYIASRLVRDIVEEHLLETLTPDRPLPLAATAEQLHDAIHSALQHELESLNAPVSRLKSRLLRALPTTMALGALQRSEPEGTGWLCHVLWAGDSRVYALDASGFHQLSVDDLKDPGDAMANLHHDSVISNAISADTDFRINHRQVTLQAPFALVCASDGCFGYVPSPMHFEDLVLQALGSATSDEEWSKGIQERVSAVTGDDASMAAVVVGATLAEFRDLLAPRGQEVAEQFTEPLDDFADEEERQRRQLAALQDRRHKDLSDRWQQYRTGYEVLLNDDATAPPQLREDAPTRQVWNPAKTITTGDVTMEPDANTQATAGEES